MSELKRFSDALRSDKNLQNEARGVKPTRRAFLDFAKKKGYSIRDEDIPHQDSELNPDWVDIAGAADAGAANACPKCFTTTCNPHNACTTSTM